jgi:hypothetical protein
MLTTRKFITSVFVAGAAAAAIIATPATAIANTPGPTPNQVILAEPAGYGSGGGDQGGGGGCYSGPGWHGCGGWNPFQGGYGSGCLNGMCGGWDGTRGWGNQ